MTKEEFNLMIHDSQTELFKKFDSISATLIGIKLCNKFADYALTELIKLAKEVGAITPEPSKPADTKEVEKR